MPESLISSAEKAGLPPGELVHVGEVFADEALTSLVDYSKAAVVEQKVHSIDDILRYEGTDTVTWVNVEGLKNVELIKAIGQHFDIHPLVLEDILNTNQRPKFEDYENYLFIVLKGLFYTEGTFNINHEQVSILVLEKFIFTFKEKQDDLFTPVKQRLKNSKGRLRNLGADYLTYVILDTIVDQYFVLGDLLEEEIESIEDALLSNPTTETLSSIQHVRKELVFVRKSVSPMRELLKAIQRSESTLIHEKTEIYYRDVYDHIIRNIEIIESYRDLISSMQDIYISSVSNKMNDIMKVLTVFASIFIPLTFIAGIYGMNFEYMPELKWKWAYPALLMFFAVISLSLLVYFKKKKWL